MRKTLLLFVLFLLAIVAPSYKSASDSSASLPSVEALAHRQQALGRGTVLEVVDGDTLVVRYRDRKEHIRLIGVDTPETRENEKLKRDARRYSDSQKHQLELGARATQFTKSKVVRGALVTLEFDAEQRDRYNRLLAYVYLPNGKMLNAMILSEGYGKLITIPPNVRYADTFRSLMRQARKERRGLWAVTDER